MKWLVGPRGDLARILQIETSRPQKYSEAGVRGLQAQSSHHNPQDDAAQLLEASRVQALTVYRKIRGSCLERRTAESAQLAFEIASMEPLGRGSLALAVAALLESLALNRLHVDPDEALNALEKSLSLGDVEYLRRSIAAMAADGRVRGEARV
ncbi:hypothetical protein [Aeropyrum camini]|uniref:hypothetical protein n=1 Tax=Aeropyrum camini TaxID=229980 RepID=UPI0012E0F947|nr:hypothetical protein [Aeropyrum camini]